MSLIRLNSGKFLVIDTVPLDTDLKKEIDTLTNNGADIEAVIATHPFHTVYFPPFYEAYPNVPYYGTPSHLRNQKLIPWAGDIMDHLGMWCPEVQMRIPDGSVFVAPLPESSNRFSSVWVFGQQSRTIHVDDTIMYVGDDSPILFKLLGKRSGTMEFHPSMSRGGLQPTEDSPVLFKAWVEGVIRDWDFDNACCAHVAVRQGGARELLQETLNKAQPLLDKIAKRNQGKTVDDDDVHDMSQYNIKGTTECG